MLKHILVTLDGSELAETALEYACQIVASDGRITLLNVVDAPAYPLTSMYPVPFATSEPDYPSMMDDLVKAAQEYLESIAKKFQSDGYTVDHIVEVGEAASVIVETTGKLNVETIVMSTHGRSGLSRWLFGSVTQKVLNVMPCPVLVVPGRQFVQEEQAALKLAKQT